MKRTAGVSVLALCVTLAGCAESTLIRSYPPGAKLYVNDQYEGVTPFMLTVPRAQFADHTFRVRLERDGYTPIDQTLLTRTCPGRVVGGIFSLGISFIFRRPTCFDSHQDFSMVPLPGQPVAAHQPTIEERLQRIERMRDQGTITNEEYEHYRGEILKGL
jgi:hypothetical protein